MLCAKIYIRVLVNSAEQQKIKLETWSHSINECFIYTLNDDDNDEATKMKGISKLWFH